MSEENFNNPETEKRWCAERRTQVVEYLKSQKVKHGRVNERPAWHAAPFVSIWAVESAKRPERVNWWVICGDLPTDYVSAAEIKDPREAILAFAEFWLNHSECMKRGACDCDQPVSIGRANKQSDLAPRLAMRAELLLKLSKDDSYWKKKPREFSKE